MRAWVLGLMVTGCIPIELVEDEDLSTGTVVTPTPGQPEVEGDVVFFWQIFQPGQAFEPIEAEWTGSTPNAITLVLGDPPPPEASYPIEDPVSGVQTDPEAPLVAMALLALVPTGTLENEREALLSMDPGTIHGMADVVLFYTPVDLPDSQGVRWLNGFWNAPLEEGFHLFDPWNAVELPLDTPVVVWLNHIWS